MLREGMIVTVHHDCGVVTGPYRIIEVQGDSHTEPSFSDAVELGSDAPKSKPLLPACLSLPYIPTTATLFQHKDRKSVV